MIGGPRSALGSAIACGILLGVFEGVGVLLSRVFSEGQRPQMAPRKLCPDSLLQRLTVVSTGPHYTITIIHDSRHAVDCYTYHIYLCSIYNDHIQEGQRQ